VTSAQPELAPGDRKRLSEPLQLTTASPLMRKPDSVVRSAALHRHDQVDQTNALTSAFAQEEASDAGRATPTSIGAGGRGS
jgi:hypothetical protein